MYVGRVRVCEIPVLPRDVSLCRREDRAFDLLGNIVHSLAVLEVPVRRDKLRVYSELGEFGAESRVREFASRVETQPPDVNTAGP